jgi:hypothetical protein
MEDKFKAIEQTFNSVLFGIKNYPVRTAMFLGISVTAIFFYAFISGACNRLGSEVGTAGEKKSPSDLSTVSTNDGVCPKGTGICIQKSSNVHIENVTTENVANPIYFVDVSSSTVYNLNAKND